MARSIPHIAALVAASLAPNVMRMMAGRLDQSLPVGNEGAGTVIAAGDSPDAQKLIDKTVAILGGAMYSQYRVIKASQCLLLPAGTTAADGASCFVNPLTAIGMVETMKLEGHKALVHTAAASNLGQMTSPVPAAAPAWPLGPGRSAVIPSWSFMFW